MILPIIRALIVTVAVLFTATMVISAGYGVLDILGIGYCSGL